MPILNETKIFILGPKNWTTIQGLSLEQFTNHVEGQFHGQETAATHGSLKFRISP